MKLISLLTPFLFVLMSLSAHAATHRIEIENMKFNPESLTVNKGDTVIWVNKDIFPHTATGDKKEFDSKEIKPSTSWKFVAKKKGEMPYACSFHPTMKAVLTVK